MVNAQAELGQLLERFRSYSPQADTATLEKAFQFSCSAHQNQQRASKEPFFTHCCAVTSILLDLKLDLASLCAGLLHDCLEDTSVSYDQLKGEFGQEVADLVAGVTKLDRLKFTSFDEYQAENWRKMLLAMAKDVRVILIKLADRLHNMRTIKYLAPEDQERISQETLTLYAPIADRVGMFAVKSELEDLTFAILQPELYRDITARLEKETASREEYVKQFGVIVSDYLSKLGISFRLSARPKHLYSIYQKMLRQNKSLEEIQDTLGIRVITDTVANCYAILGEIHSRFRPVPNSFTDYIAQPKSNLYQSIHTTVYGPGDKVVEVQIRTEEMHRRSEYGIAAHWKYKLTSQSKIQEKELEANLNWLREWMEWLQELKNPSEFLESLKVELKVHQIFVFTPKMEVKSLPERASPVDFAYKVHTDIGNHCFGAKINGKMVKLDYELKSGDICEILTRKNSKPNEDWLVFVKTAKARSRIRKELKGS